MYYSRLIIVCIFMVAAVATASAQWTNGQAADLVLGQRDFTSNSGGRGADSLKGPNAIAIDPATGKLFVADIANHRVLRWPAVTSLATGMPAEAVLGQTNFDTTSAAVARNRMNFPTDIAIDAAGRLWVADALNNRVLRFDNAAVKPTGADADGVLGQTDFTSKLATVSRKGMQYTRGIAVDGNGTLYVSDQSNNRILRFDNAAAKANGADADGVLGQPDFTSNKDTLLRSGLKWPRGLVVDPQGRLYVASSAQNRVLRFDNAAMKANGADADAVLGQADFTSSSSAAAQSGMREPCGVALDATGRLYVVDADNNRVLLFDDAASKANGAEADGVLGQPDFVSNTPTVSQTGMNFPWGCAVESVRGKLWVADPGNNRVLRFSASEPLSAGSVANAVEEFTLARNFPNPMRSRTTFAFTLPRQSPVRLDIYSMLGEKLHTLVDAGMSAGTHRFEWTNDALPSGAYAVVLRAGGSTAIRVMNILR
jgi:DNA-binding beta-propeller fold protein YncE